MKLAHPQWVNTLEWDSMHPASLILENPDLYRSVVQDLSMQAEGSEGELVFSENSIPCSIAKEGILVRDIWSIDLNQKKLLSGVYRRLTHLAQEEYYTQLCQVIHQGTLLVEELERDSMLSLSWEPPADMGALLKAYGVRLDCSEDPFERLLEYAQLAKEFLGIHFLVLVGVRSFLTDEACTALCRELACYELSVLWVEPACRELLNHEVRLIIDKDLCELRFP